MSTANTPAVKPKRRWFQFRLRTMLLGVGLFALLLGMVVHFWPHVWWKLHWRRMGYQHFRSVPTAPMPPADAPDDWVGCRFGPLEFDLPRSLAEGLQAPAPGNSRRLHFEDGTRRLRFSLPDGADMLGETLEILAAKSTGFHRLSQARFLLATYEASSDDYRWTMSRKELTDHACMVRMRGFGELEARERVEVLFREDIEGLLDVYSEWAIFEWYSTDGRAFGFLIFDRESENSDLTWVRAVCRSLRFSGELYPDEVTGEELAELLEIVEPEP